LFEEPLEDELRFEEGAVDDFWGIAGVTVVGACEGKRTDWPFFDPYFSISVHAVSSPKLSARAATRSGSDDPVE